MSHSAEQMLRTLFKPDDLIEFRPIECWTEGNKKRSRTFPRRYCKLSNLNGTFDLLAELNKRSHANAFFGVCPRATAGGTKNHVKIIRAAWGDLDDCTPDEALDRCREARLPEPNIVVNSGHGVHLYWLFCEPFNIKSIADGARAEAAIQQLGKLIGSDSTFDRNRVLRLPGFPNVKNARNGAPPTACELVKLDAEPVLESIEELIGLLPESARHRIDWSESRCSDEADNNAPTHDGKDNSTASPPVIPEELRAQVESRLTRHAKKNDRSTYSDFPLLKDLIRKGLTKEVIWELVRPYSKFSERNGRKYFDRSYANASSEIAADDEPIFDAFSASPGSPSASTVAVASPRLTGQAKLRTDVGNAARFALQHGKDVRFCYATDKWFVWDGVRWRPDDVGRAIRLAKNTALSVFDEAKQAETEEARKALSDHAVRSQRRDRIAAMLELAKPELAIRPGQFDRDPWALNTKSGILDLRTGELRPHDRAVWMTKIAPVNYQRDAECKLWLTFLDRIFKSNEAQIEFVQRLLGYSLSGDIGLQLLPIFHGEGGNGKNVLLDTVCGIMGDYATKASPDLLVSNRQDHPTGIADLMGRRLVVASETEEAARLKLQLVKELTGDARLKARFMRQDFFEFARTFKTVLVTNNKPRVRENTEAAWRRIRLVPFDVVIPPAERDTELLHKLRKEWPGILAWLVRGCVAYCRHGLSEPSSVTVATSNYRRESDTISQFIDECCVLQPHAWAASGDLRQSYERWSDERGERPLGGNAFTDRLAKAGAEPKKLNHRRGWSGIGLLAACESDQEEVA